MSKINPKIFKAYDIRGIYPTDLNEELAYLIGQAIVKKTKAKKMVVGRDMRIGAESLTKKLIEGINSQGIDVDDIGLVAIDTVYFAVGKYDYEAGVMCTASHNPKEYSGFKMPTKKDGIEYLRGTELYEFMKENNFKFNIADKKGEITEKDILPEYIKHVLSFADIKKIKPFKIVADAGNGMAGKIIPLLFKHLPCKIIPLNFKLDGTFPGHPSNPLLPEAREQIINKVVEEKADFGVIMDGDTDRLYFINEKGDFIRADTTLLILAKYFLNHYPGIGIAYNVICSKAVPELVKKWGGRPIRSKVGFANVAQATKDNDGIMGGEVSAHYSFKDNYYADSGFIALVILLMLISESNQKLSEITKDLNPYSRSDEVNIEVENIPDKITKVKEKYADGKQDELDGVTVEYDNWWFNVRPSNTEPLLRITVEGNNKELMEEKREELVNFIKSL